MRETVAIVFGGDCRFCTRTLASMQRIDTRGVMQLHDSHSAGTTRR